LESSRAEKVSAERALMDPLDVGLTVLLGVSFGLSLVLLAIVTLILEAFMFAIGVRRRDW
jgi:hypothetical protein